MIICFFESLSIVGIFSIKTIILLLLLMKNIFFHIIISIFIFLRGQLCTHIPVPLSIWMF